MEKLKEQYLFNFDNNHTKRLFKILLRSCIVSEEKTKKILFDLQRLVDDIEELESLPVLNIIDEICWKTEDKKSEIYNDFNRVLNEKSTINKKVSTILEFIVEKS